MRQGRDPAAGICHGGLSAEGFLFKPQAAAAAVGPRCFRLFFLFFFFSGILRFLEAEHLDPDATAPPILNHQSLASSCSS